MIELRDYQKDAVDATLSSFVDGCHGLVVLPTGSGKSLVAAQIMLEYRARGYHPLLLTHRKELLIQDEAAIINLVGDDRYNAGITGIYCAGLGRRESDAPIVLASIGSIHKDPSVLCKRDVILIDEAHLCPKDGMGMYQRTLLGHFKDSRRIGLTATPFRIDSGNLLDGDDALFDEIFIHVTARELVDQGYLSPLVGVAPEEGEIDTSGVRKRAGDFIASELEQVAAEEEVIAGAVKEIVRLGSDRTRHLLFCVTVDHARSVAEEMTKQGLNCLPVWGNMPAQARAYAIEALRRGEVRALANVDVLTTGIDIPQLDCISLLRPTLSRSRYIQAIGRGMRIAEGKRSCKILDFAGNCRRFGDIDALGMDSFQDVKEERLAEERKEREAIERRRIQHETRAAIVDPMATGQPGIREVPVYGVRYDVWAARKHQDLKNLVVTYDTPEGKIRKWVCVEYKSAARFFAERWFSLRGVPRNKVPRTAAAARVMARTLEAPSALSVGTNDSGWPEVRIEHWATSAPEQMDIVD